MWGTAQLVLLASVVFASGMLCGLLDLPGGMADDVIVLTRGKRSQGNMVDLGVRGVLISSKARQAWGCSAGRHPQAHAVAQQTAHRMLHTCRGGV